MPIFLAADELLADDLPLRLRVADARQLAEEAFLRVHANEIEIPLGECRFDLIALILAHQAVIDKNAGELAADGLRHERRRDRRIHAAGERKQRLAGADLFADGLDRRLAVICHRPIAGGFADAVEEVPEHQAPLLRMVDLRMELHTVDPARLIADANGRAGVGVRAERKAGRHLGHVIAVAHPSNAFFLQAVEQLAARVKIGLRFAVFAGRILLRRRDLAAKVVRNELAAIADAKDRQPEREDLRIYLRRVFGIDALRAAGEDEADGVMLHQLLQRRGAGLDLAIYVCLADTARNELVILPAEIQYDHTFLCLHCKTSHFIFSHLAC
mgnify:CR=1 FL=1